jgi:SAM-dependent methyltransferase
MTDQIRQRWDAWFLDKKSYQLDIQYTPWLEKYIGVLKSLKSAHALDLGCGRGFDSKYLRGLGFRTVSSDYSWGALLSTRKTLRSTSQIQFDMRGGFPFQFGIFGLVVANLSLHYFSLEKTIEIIHLIHEVLKPGGWLIARVNSTSDLGFQSVKNDLGARIEDEYVFYHDLPRRYFSETALRQLFAHDWEISRLEERVLTRYEKPKALWEIAAQRN